MLKHTLRRLMKPFRAPRHEREMEYEMRTHIEMEAESLVQSGVPQDEAMRRAAASFGGVARFRDDARDAWAFRWTERVISDIRFALRSLRQSPSFTLTAVAALALGMGANGVVFRTIDSIALRPLDVRSPDRVVALYGSAGEVHWMGFSYPTFSDLRRDTRAFDDLAAITEGPVNLTDGSASVVWAAHISDNYFSMLGVDPAMGTLIQRGDLEAPIVVLSHAFWQTRFGGNPAVIGQTLRINDAPFRIVGVAPAQFIGTKLFGYEPAVWLPAGMHRQTIPGSGELLSNRQNGRFLLIGRLAAGVGLRQAENSANAIATRLADAYPELYRGLTIQVVSNRTPINPWLAAPDKILAIGELSLLGVSLVLLIACANVASLSLARMAARRDEFAVRLSLGASRGRIVQQLITESLVLAILAAIVAIPIAMVGALGMARMAPHLDYPSSWRPADGSRVFMYSVVVTIASALLFGLAPALRISRDALVAGLRSARPVVGGRRLRLHLRELLVVGQVALSVVVLGVAGLFTRSLYEAKRLDTGFDTHGAVAFTIDPQLSPTYDAARTRELYSRLTERLATLPGVRGVGRAMYIPLDGNSSVRHVFTAGSPTTVERAPAAEFNATSPGYFAAIGTPLVAGRDFVSADSASSANVAIVNEVLAARLWPHESPIGKQLHIDSPSGGVVEVIGVARASNYRSLGERPRAALWVDLDRTSRSRTTLVVRSSRDAAALLPEVRAIVHELDPTLPLIGLGTLRDHISLSYSAVESGAFGALGFGILAALLTASAIAGLVAFGVAQRTREIAIRVALGAPPSSILRMVVRRSVLLCAAGFAMGLTVLSVVPMGLDRLLFVITPHDPLTLLAAGGVFAAIAAVAALVPTQRATRIDPMTALRVAAILMMVFAVQVDAQTSTSIEKGRVAYNAHKSDEAIKFFEEAVVASPDSAAPHMWLGRALVQAIPNASFLRQPILARRARQQFDRAIEIDPRNVDVREDRAIYYLNAPAIAGGGVDKARTEAQVVRGLDAYRGGMLSARIEEHEKRAPAAEAEYAALAKSHPDSAGPFNGLLAIYQNAKRYAEAFALIDARAASRADDAYAVYQLGKTAALSGERLEAGEAALQKYIHARRFDIASEANARYRLGMIFEQQKKPEQARAEYEAAVKLDPRLEDAARAAKRLSK